MALPPNSPPDYSHPSHRSGSFKTAVEKVGKLLHATYNNADSPDLQFARCRLQSWALIKWAWDISNVDELCRKLPEFRRGGNDGHQIYGEQVWSRMQDWWNSCETWLASGIAIRKRYTLGKTLKEIVEFIYKISPLNAEIDPFNLNLTSGDIALYFPTGYVSGLQVVDHSLEENYDTSEQQVTSSRVSQLMRRMYRQNQKSQYPLLSDISSPEVEIISTFGSSGPVIEDVADEESQIQAAATRQDGNERRLEEIKTEGPAVIKTLYMANLRALRAAVARMYQKENLLLLISRFIAWGCSLFASPIDLDAILQTTEQSVQFLRTHLIGILADIALVLVHLLRSVETAQDSRQNKSLVELQACFGRFTDANEKALEIPESFYDDIQEEKQKPLQELLERQLAGLTDCMFDILPAISRVRQVHLLNLERESQSLPVTTPAPLPLQVSQPEFLVQRSGIRNDRSYGSGFLASGMQTKGMQDSGKTPMPAGKAPMLEMLAMDLELAEAIKASLIETRASRKSQQSEDKGVMQQIMAWEKEISRLRSWSEAFESSLGDAPSTAEIQARIEAFEQLVNIGCIFVGAMPPNLNRKSILSDSSSAEQQIKRVVALMPKVGSIDVKIDHSGKSPSAALKALTQTNINLPSLPGITR